MGTNYYLVEPEGNHCAECGRFDEGKQRHIGKSSAGWVFALHVYPEEGIRDLDDWLPLLADADARIRSEYGVGISLKEMLQTITIRHRPDDQPFTADWLIRNHAVRGPHNLARENPAGFNYVSPGRGTWDRHVGEFS